MAGALGEKRRNQNLGEEVALVPIQARLKTDASRRWFFLPRLLSLVRTTWVRFLAKKVSAQSANDISNASEAIVLRRQTKTRCVAFFHAEPVRHTESRCCAVSVAQRTRRHASMNFFNSPRQPLLSLALAAIGGILVAEFFPAPIEQICAGVLLAGIACVVRPTGWLAYLLVATAFYTLHLVQQTDAPGKELSRQIGDRTRVVSVTGTVKSEPRISPNEFMTFLLQLDTIELGGAKEVCPATVRVRWKGNPKLGDRLKLSGVVEAIPPPRNPGEFDMRAYLARHDVYNSVFVRYTEDGDHFADWAGWACAGQRRANPRLDASDADSGAGRFTRCRSA